MPFGEARQYVRNLGFRNTQEFKVWLNSGVRPAFIPANPYLQYREHGWDGFPNFLGYEPPVVLWHKPGYQDEIAEKHNQILAGNSPFSIQLRGFVVFEEFMGPHSESVLEFRRFGPRNCIQYVFRPRRLPAAEKWSPLIFRTRRAPMAPTTVVLGRVSEAAPTTAMVFLLGDPIGPEKKFFFIPTSVVAALAAKYGKGKNLMLMRLTQLAEFEIESGFELASKLLEHYRDGQDHVSTDDCNYQSYFLPQGGRYGQRLAHLRLQLASTFYSRLGASVDFGSSMQRDSLSDVVVGLGRVIHRTVMFERRGENDFRASVDTSRYQALHSVPLHEDDDFDFIIVVDHDPNDSAHTLIGVFILPKSALKENLASDERPGKLHAPLYSPRMPTKTTRSQRRKEFCLRYYIDVSNPEILDEQIEKAKAIFDGRVDVADAVVSISGEGEGKSGVVLSDSVN